MKKYIFIILLSFVPSVMMAQAAGGTIRRPSQKAQSHNKTSSKPLSPNEMKKKQVLKNLVSNMVFVDGGTFLMGRTQEQDNLNWGENRIPVHQVTLSSFYIAKYEVTQEEWQTIMGHNPSNNEGDHRPVESVSWEDCQIFINKLNHLTGRKFRLPTEAEWEYASRGGKFGIETKYAGSNICNEVAWNCNNSNGNRTAVVGMKLPNELGLYDMSGNVWEWCQDWYGEYRAEPQTNPHGAEIGKEKVCRGGCWLYGDFQCLVSCRSKYNPDSRYQHLGFRLAL